MAAGTILAGAADAIGRARGLCDAVGAVVLGPGEVGLPVLARAPDWRSVDFRGLPAHALVLACPPADGAEARTILERAAEAGLKVSLIEKERVRRLRLDDLIGRPPAKFDDLHLGALISDKRVLITGGGGSIGAELGRRIAALAPARLTVLDNSELNLFRVSLDLPKAIPVLADIRDAGAMRRWFSRERPEIVFHAAALKQVPLVEAFPSEGVLTNIGGLRHIAEAGLSVGADLVFVSTDKAVAPSGVMGATKRLGELYCQALDRHGPCRAVPVRLGNVLGSAGSVAPTFEAQLASGGPLTVTDPNVSRFFVTIPQAAESILCAAAFGIRALTRGAVYVLDMGEALQVVELAREVIRLEGLRPGVDMHITFTGLRPGEKLHELLVGADEWREPDPGPGVIAAVSPPRGLAELHEAMERLCALAHEGSADAARRELFAALVAPPVTKTAAMRAPAALQ